MGNRAGLTFVLDVKLTFRCGKQGLSAVAMKSVEVKMRSKLAREEALPIRVIAKCLIVEGDEVNLELEGQINSFSRVNDIGRLCQEKLRD